MRSILITAALACSSFLSSIAYAEQVNIYSFRQSFLIDPILAEFSKESGKKTLKINAQIKAILTKYTWPGNIRELENFIHRLVIMTDKKVVIDDIPDYMKMNAPIDVNQDNLLSLAEVEKKHIEKVFV